MRPVRYVSKNLKEIKLKHSSVEGQFKNNEKIYQAEIAQEMINHQ
jgi:hypothetical protein